MGHSFYLNLSGLVSGYCPPVPSCSNWMYWLPSLFLTLNKYKFILTTEYFRDHLLQIIRNQSRKDMHLIKHCVVSKHKQSIISHENQQIAWKFPPILIYTIQAPSKGLKVNIKFTDYDGLNCRNQSNTD